MGLGISDINQKLGGENKYSQIKASFYSKELALEHGFNAAIDKLIRVCGAEIFVYRQSYTSCAKPKQLQNCDRNHQIKRLTN